MEFLCPVAIVVFIVLAIIGNLLPNEETSGSSTSPTGDEFRISYKFDDIADANDTKPYIIARFTFSGTITVPKDNQRVNCCVNLLDITESYDDPYPILCHLSDFANEDGFFHSRQEFEIPYSNTVFKSLELVSIPLFPLVGPKKGWRKWQAYIFIADFYNEDLVYASATTILKYKQPDIGYLEYKEFAQKQQQNMAKLALGLAAADGRITKTETSSIREFFSQLFSQYEDAPERKKFVTETLQSTLNELRSGVNSSTIITSACKSFREDEDSEATQQAYKLCVKVAAADGELGSNEEKALAFIAKLLEIPTGYIEEIHDREVRLHMKNDNQIGMPTNLTVEEQKSWLTKEYRKWRQRSTNSDAEIATEATLRVNQIMALLDKLNQGKEDNDTAVFTASK